MTHFDKNIQSDLILIDFAKAFDTVPHQRLYTSYSGMVCEAIFTDRFNPSSPEQLLSCARWCQLLTGNGHFWSSTTL